MIRIVRLLIIFFSLAEICAASPRTPALPRTTASPRTAASPTITSLQGSGALPGIMPAVIPLAPYVPIPLHFPEMQSFPFPAIQPSPASATSAKIEVSARTAISPQTASSRRTASSTIIAVSRRDSKSLRTKSSTKTTESTTKKAMTTRVSWNSRNMKRFVKRLEEKCNFDLLFIIHKELKNIWDEVMNDGGEDTSSEMDDMKKFLKKIIDLYNGCSEKMPERNFDLRWEIYKKIFGKEYSAKENEMRKAIFNKSKQDVEEHNELFKHGLVSYSANLNHLSDWTDEELEMMNGSRPSNATINDHSKRKPRFVEGEMWRHYYHNIRNRVPTGVDWRTKGNYVNPVQSQGKCGSCYAIAGLGALEAHHRKRTGDLARLSVQNILDCTWHLGNIGCIYGYTVTVFEYAHSTGIVSNRQYPYTMNASYNCRWRREDVVATNRGYYAVDTNSELALRDAVADYGPVAADITPADLHKYRSGVFYTKDTGPLNHAVLVVGYGTDPQYGDYWIVKNSWGYWWGENGYARIVRNRNNVCRIAASNYFPY